MSGANFIRVGWELSLEVRNTPPEGLMDRSMERIFFDANAGSRLRPEGIAALSFLLPQFERYGNPSSVHREGREARALLSIARKHVLSFLEVPQSSELFFTSGGTEGCNALVHGYLNSEEFLSDKTIPHVICLSVEHPAILEPLNLLSREGKIQLTLVRPTPLGEQAADYYTGCFLRALDEAVERGVDTQLICLMAAHNESGVIFPVVEVVRALRQAGYQGAFISDVAQLVGKAELSLREMFESGVDAVALSGAKLGAPGGIGAVVLNTACVAQGGCRRFRPLLAGGAQENWLRAGTENFLGAVVLGTICESLTERLAAEIKKRSELTELLWSELNDIPGIICYTPMSVKERVCNTLLVGFNGIRGDDLVVALDLEGVACSTGSACASGRQEPSRWVQEIGGSAVEARSVVRFSLDWDATNQIVSEASKRIRQVVTRMQPMHIKHAYQDASNIQLTGEPA